MKYKCKHCKSIIDTPDNMMGRKEICPDCQTINVVPFSKEALELKKKAEEEKRLKQNSEEERIKKAKQLQEEQERKIKNIQVPAMKSQQDTVNIDDEDIDVDIGNMDTDIENAKEVKDSKPKRVSVSTEVPKNNTPNYEWSKTVGNALIFSGWFTLIVNVIALICFVIKSKEIIDITTFIYILFGISSIFFVSLIIWGIGYLILNTRDTAINSWYIRKNGTGQ